MTYRERREARAARLREWAAKRESSANAQLRSQPDLRSDWAFITQPGHIPERARMNAADDRAFRSLDKAESMNARAAEIERQADHAIYSDDPDAAERLRERIADLEAKRSRYAAENAAHRKAHRAELAAMTPYQRSQAVPHAAYELSNLGGNISRLRARLDAIEHPRPTWFHASRRDPGTCYKCDAPRADHAPHPQAPTILMCPVS
jgi:hypothetical protein